MTLYLDSSAILRILLMDRTGWTEIAAYPRRVTSELSRVECLRTLDRVRIERRLDEAAQATQRASLDAILRDVDTIAINHAILARAAEPMPSVLGTLDAIHLATALLWQEEHDEEVAMATHDTALARVARTFGMPIVPPLQAAA